jgi:hypothetical protein
MSHKKKKLLKILLKFLFEKKKIGRKNWGWLAAPQPKKIKLATCSSPRGWVIHVANG